jgi:hypothetical protein
MRSWTVGSPIAALAWIPLLFAGTTKAAQGPCDLYAEAGTPCVAAHSTVRALYGTYAGALYQVRRVKTNTTKDIPVLAAGGLVDISVQDQFCTDSCTISILYDQSPRKNHLAKSPKAYYLKNGGVEASASDGLVQVGGRKAHGIAVTGKVVQWYETDTFPAVAYRNNATQGIATGNQAESMYMVVDGTRYSAGCCFDYGNVETTGNDDGNGTMEALYWGTNTSWGGKGDGTGPWIAADLENGMFKADRGGKGSDTMSFPNAKTITAKFASAFLKGPADSTFALKAGNAQSGTLTTMWNGPRPSPNYFPKKLQGAILLGTGGDGSRAGTGTFFEGAMTLGNPPDSVDDQIQANIVATYAGAVTSVRSASQVQAGSVGLDLGTGEVRVRIDNAEVRGCEVLGLNGRRMARLSGEAGRDGIFEAIWDARGSAPGLYIVRARTVDGADWRGTVLIGR